MKESYINIKILIACMVSALMLASSCSDSLPAFSEKAAEEVINVAGIETEEATVITRAASMDAEKVSWLVQPLKNGLDITYGLHGVSKAESMEDVAILKLIDETTSPATYSFNYRMDNVKHNSNDEPAIWHNNGFHYFQGVHVPERIRYTTDISEVETKAPDLMLDQHDDNATGTDAQLGNYTLLSHYLGMPANYTITATVERIKLPFRHRLARVVAFVLIDPELHTTLKGYKKDADGQAMTKEDPNTTSFRFCNVKVLQGVKDVTKAGSSHHTLTPIWKSARKVVPHFDGERGSYNYKTLTLMDDDFKMYVGSSNNKADELYPTSQNWKSVHDAAGHNGYKEINYGKVPVYDIIVRPTYTNYENVMYDEEGYDADNKTKLQELANASNSIDFDIELDNGLRYEKTFHFDLNANYQTVVYLRISREKVDYDDAGSEIWVEKKGTDNWYGVDNENGNVLSMAGSSWQRAYRTTKFSTSDDKVTDGDFYNNNNESTGQYLGDDKKWTELLLQACVGGKHHGDYFILDNDITINAQDIPADFVFTGHLDSQDHIITLTGTSTETFEETTNYSLIDSETLYNNINGNYVPFTIPTLYVSKEIAQAKPRIQFSRTMSETIPAGSGKMVEVTPKPKLTQIMSNDVAYYEKVGDTYVLWNPRELTFYTKRISAASLFCGLNGTYTTNQESASPARDSKGQVIWEANVHKETNTSTRWVPTLGYRAEVLNTVIRGGTLFPYSVELTGNVQNCFILTSDGKQSVTHTPDIPKYK